MVSWSVPRVLAVLASAVTLGCFGFLFFPEVLGFPYYRQVGDTKIYSDLPISSNIGAVLARSDRLLKASPIFGPHYGRRIFLTNGGWRWKLLSMQAAGAFAFTRNLTETIIVNRTDVAHDVVSNGLAIGGRRSLSGVIAHERTHGLIRGRFGLFADAAYPAWLREGYCDVVAGGGSLSDADADLLRRRGEYSPAMTYYDGRKRVEASLRRNGGSVDRLFHDTEK